MKFSIKLLFSILFNLFVVVTFYGQAKIIGTVKDSRGENLYGVTVKIKGKKATGVITDVDGHYSIDNVKSTDILVFSLIGKKTIESLVGDRSVLDISLEEDIESLEDVIVVAYGTTKKSTFTGSATVINEKRIQDAQVTNLSNALQGTGAGIQSLNYTGQPGSGATIRIRGIGSISGSSSPLIVLDGVPYDGYLSSINTTDISSMTVLKDAASSSIYGSRAANGVIIITTKQGSVDKEPIINIKSTAGIVNRAVKPVELLNTNQWAEMKWEAIRNGYIDEGYSSQEAAKMASAELVTNHMGINPWGLSNPEPVGLDGKIKPGLNPMWDDNWDKALIGTGQRYETNISLTGGNKTTQYFFSGGYLKEKGMLIRSGFERFSSRLNVTTKAKDWIRINLNISYINSSVINNDGQGNAVTNVTTHGLMMNSFYPIYQRDPNTGDFILDDKGNKIYDFGSYRLGSYKRMNLLYSLPMTKDEESRNQVSIRTSADIDISKINSNMEFLKGLNYKISYSSDISTSRSHNYYVYFLEDPTNIIGVKQDLSNNLAYRGSEFSRSYTLNHILSYNKIIDDIHKVSILAGQESYEYITKDEKGSRRSFPVSGIPEPNLAANLVSFTTSNNRFAIYSVFSKIEYSLMGKYNISGSYRRDGSSKFHPDNRWGNFWSLGLGWNMEKEDFIKDLTFINLLKLKMSYGSSGNQSIGTYYAYQNYLNTGRLGNESVLSIGRIGNPDLKWEGNIVTNIGLDFALFENKLIGNIELFQRESDDLIYSLPLPNSTGLTSLTMNAGSMRNRGLELELKGTLVSIDKFVWNLGVNLTHYKNKITDFPVEEGVISGTKRMKKGQDMYAYYIREFAGNSKQGEIVYDMDPVTDKIYPTTIIAPGSPTWWIYDEKTGKKYKTGIYNNATRKEVGSALPDLYGGISTDIIFYDFMLSALISYNIGGYLYIDNGYVSTISSGTGTSPMNKIILERWTSENQNSDLPRLTTLSTSNPWGSTSTRFLYDASYMRLKTLTLSYNVPKDIIEDFNVGEVRIFLQGENLFTIFNLQGVDPESGGLSGVVSDNYPITRVLSVGMNLNF